MVMEIALSLYENNGVDICSDMKLSGLEFTEDCVLLEEINRFG